MKRLFWFSVGAAAGAYAATQLADKVKQDGLALTLAQAQAWAAPKVAELLKQVSEGSHGIR